MSQSPEKIEIWALNLRQFPDIDKTLHCIAVRVNDELLKIMKTKEWTNTNVIKVKELTNLLLMVRKTAPKLEEEAKNKPFDDKSKTKNDKMSNFDELTK